MLMSLLHSGPLGTPDTHCRSSASSVAAAHIATWQAARPQQQQQAWQRLQRCRRQWQRQHQLCPVLASYNTNPQNVDNPVVLPSPDLSAEEAVRVQLEALQQNDQPWGNHGVQTCYEFAFDVGGLDPSMYFGFRKDLYHFDHFMGQFATRLGTLINASSFTIGSSQEQAAEGNEPATAVVTAEVVGARSQQPAVFEFQLRRKTVGPRKGAWTTFMLRQVEGS